MVSLARSVRLGPKILGVSQPADSQWSGLGLYLGPNGGHAFASNMCDLVKRLVCGSRPTGLSSGRPGLCLKSRVDVGLGRAWAWA
jgi:hypothetical protein